MKNNNTSNNDFCNFVTTLKKAAVISFELLLAIKKRLRSLIDTDNFDQKWI